jgi:hypothetical protein
VNLREYYHLKRDTFTVNPDDDADVYFGGAELEGKIKMRILRDFNQERAVPKFMIYGPYGGGKTHTLRHVEHQLHTDPDLQAGLPAVRTLRYELAPIRSKERWTTVHTRLMNAIGQDLVRDAAATVLANPEHATDPLPHLQAQRILRFGETAIQASQAQIFRNMLFGGRQATLSWEWLKGRKLTVDETQMLGTQANLAEPADLVHALLNVASLVKAGTEQKLVVLMDEGEALGNLSAADSIHEFQYSLRRLFDDDNDVLGLIVAYQFSPGIDRVPDVLSYDAIRRRVGYDAGYIDLTGHISVPANAHTFITDLLEHLVDQQAAAATIAAQGLNTQPEYFPFEEDAVDLVAEFVTADPQNSLPSQIITKMADAVIDAWLSRDPSTDQRRLVDEAVVTPLLYPA